MIGIQSFIRFNFRISEAITPTYAWGAEAQRVYYKWGVEFLSSRPRRIIDVGAGKKWHFAELKTSDMEVIGIDIEVEEMTNNPSLDHRIEGDCCKNIPVGNADIVMARAVVEHFHDNEAFCHNVFSALKPGGVLIATFPNKWAPFAIINRMVPNRVAQFLLKHLFPGYGGFVGFEAHYDRCTPNAFRKALTDAGLVVEREFISYFSSMYFAGLFPIYLISLAFDCLRHVAGVPAFSSYLAYTARKPITPDQSRTQA